MGTAAAFAAPFAATVAGGFLTFKAGQLVLKPQVRKALGEILEKSGKALNPKDKKIIEDLLKDFKDTPNKKGGFVANPLGDLGISSKSTNKGKTPLQQKKESVDKSSTNNSTEAQKSKQVKIGDKTF